MNWDISPELFSIGPLTVRWYGLLFASSFIIGYYIMLKIYREDKRSEDDLNDLIWYMILGTVLGARLGHCLFYNPAYYLANPHKILMVWEGGLASHGASIGILLAVYLYSKKKAKQPFLWLMDRLVITVALGGAMIRLGNLFNSEIVGRPTDVPWAFVFPNAHVADPLVPRHPAQIYESLAYLIVFIVLTFLFKKQKNNPPQGQIFGLFMIMVFGFRFFVEFYKENQTYFEEGMFLNMGQILSIPLVLFGIYLVIRSKSKVNN